MKVIIRIFLVGCVFLGTRQVRAERVTFYGASDASAAVALDEEHFVVADDENNTLRIYRFDRPSGRWGR